MRNEANPKLKKLTDMFNWLLSIVFGYQTITDSHYEERRARFDWQNLREDPKGNARGFPWHGRAWFYWNGNQVFNWEWVIWTFKCFAAIEIGKDEGGWIKLQGGFPPFALYTGFGRKMPFAKWWIKHYRYDTRVISLRIFDWAIWWDGWMDPHSWNSKESKLRRFVFHIDDFFLGKQIYSKVILSEKEVKIPMPEGNYPAVVIMDESTWKRPRWPFPQRVRKAEVKLHKPIPFPGKGENSWDCGEDALHGQTAPAKTVEEAISKVVESVLRNRRRYGGNAMMEYPAPGDY